ncbi:uncharacterized protein LOC109843293 [Asparagus officinalis]|uniref:uncharacterized protein LOC109843293 n=1 Tax=Asparagus officinalis TaxID=4686 RepID=UPI00098DE96C|nr:uncharacterized protein LOC109843293 [Asparagus officinalis]
MAARNRDSEFWLPSDILTDDFFADGEKPGESDDDDDPVAALARQLMGHSLARRPTSKASAPMATSPQSTLSGLGSWSFSSYDSPDGPSQVSSPPSTPFQEKEGLDLLCSAAGQVERLGPNCEFSRGPLGPCHSHYLRPYSNQDLLRQRLQQARFYELRRRQLIKQQQEQEFLAAVYRRPQENRARIANAVYGVNGVHQRRQQPVSRSGMTPVLFDGARRRSNGTGVFLPRRTPIEPKRQPACSPVLLPAGVVQALNLNVDEMGTLPRLPGYYYVSENAAVMGGSNLKRNQEVCLPQDWSY